MPLKITLWQRKHWSLQLFFTLPSEVEALLEELVWGTPGGIRYTHPGSTQALDQMGATYFLTLLRREQVLSTLGFVHKSARLASQADLVRAYYVRYLAFDPRLQNRQVGAQASVRPPKASHVLKQQIGRIFEADSPLQQVHGSEEAPTLFYAYVIGDNARSAQLTESFGFQAIRRFRTRFFTRLFPRKKAAVACLTPTEIPTMEKQLAHFYQGYGFLCPDDLQLQAPYYVWRENGEIVAGVQVRVRQWTVQELPGREGKLMLHVLPHIPILRRVFNPRAFRFGGFDGLYVKKGHENILPDLFEGVLAAERLHSAMLWLDDQTALFHLIDQLPGMGLLSPLMGQTAWADVIVRPLNFKQDPVSLLKQVPHYISGLDVV